MKRGAGRLRALWGAVILLAGIGVAVVVRRTVHLGPIVLHGYRPPAAPPDPVRAQLAARRAFGAAPWEGAQAPTP